MALLLAAFVVVGFALLVGALDLPTRAHEVGTRARDCLGVLRDPSLDDRDKEEALQRQAVRLFGLLGILLGGSLLALGLPLGAVWLLDLGELASLGAVLNVLERPDFLIGATLIGGAAYAALRKVRSP